MKRLTQNTVFLAVTAFLMMACTNSGAGISSREDMLIEAGFVPKSAGTPSRVAALKSLPAHRFVSETINGRTVYLYADPTVCGCIYVGNQQAYDRYHQVIAARQITTDEQVRAIVSSAPLPGEMGL